VTNQLRDIQAIHFQHVQIEKANNGNSRALAEQIQQQQLGLKEGAPTNQTMPPQIQSAREQGMVSDIEQQIDIEHQWIFKLDRQHWRQYLPPGWSSSGPLQLVLETLLHSPVIPLWAAVNPIATEWAALQAAWWAMHFQGQKMDEFLNASYSTEEEIKTALKFIPQAYLDDKMEKVNTTLLRECTVNTHLPLEITTSVKSHVKSYSNRIQDYKDKVRYINEKKTRQRHHTTL
jgi:hypothetical protein